MELSSSDSDQDHEKRCPRAAITRGGIRPLPKNSPARPSKVMIEREDFSDDNDEA